MTRPTSKQVRSAVLFVGGLAGVAYETLVSEGTRPTLLVLFAGMMGLPLFMRADEKTKAKAAAAEAVTTDDTQTD